MNNNFYILPNDEGYLVKSYNNDDDIALFKKRNDAEIFINALTSSSVSSVSNYPQIPEVANSIPLQYLTSYPQQQIVTPCQNNSANGVASLPQIFFIQQPPVATPLQQEPTQLCPIYQKLTLNCPLTEKKEIYTNCHHFQNNSSLFSCACEFNNINYKKHFEKKIEVNNTENSKCSQNNSLSNPIINNQNLKEESIICPKINNIHLKNENKEKIIDKQFIENNNFASYNINQEENNDFLDKQSLNKQYDNNYINNYKPEFKTVLKQFIPEQQFKQEELINNNLQQYKQEYISNPFFSNQKSEKLQKQEPLQEFSQKINLTDDNEKIFNFINDKYNNISKKEKKHLIKKKLKEIKKQKKLEKQNLKKNRKNNLC